MAVHGRFRKAYGINACNLREQSLARVVAQEYGDMDLTIRCMNSPGLYRSIKTERAYSKCQTVELEPYHGWVEPEEPQTALKLPLFIWFLGTTRLLILKAWMYQSSASAE
jgi:hypothetical protein